jgi:hypothetical protein
MRWEAQPRQAKFLLNVLDPDGPDEILYGGAAGGGKTESLLIACIVWCQKYPGTWVLFLRRTYPELEAKPIPRSKELIPRRVAQYQEVKHRWTFANGSVLQFGSLDKSGDEYKYQGAEFSLIAFDELTHFQEGQYLYLLSRNRTTNPEIRPKVIAATNPGGPGHAWVKARWIDPAKPETVWEAPQTPEQAAAGLPPRKRCFIPARVQDNQILCRADPGYVARLMELPEAERRALLDGDWDVFAGQVFKEFRRDVHVIDPFPIPPEWRRWRALDFGYTNPACVLWLALGPDETVYVYRELYVTGMKASELAQKVVELSRGEHITLTMADPAVFAKTGHEGESIERTLRENGLPVQKADNDRLAGKQRVHDYLTVFDGWDGKPTSRLKIFSTCTNLIRTLPQLVYDQNRPEDVDTDCEDHAYDALRYALMNRPAVRTQRSRQPRVQPISPITGY